MRPIDRVREETQTCMNNIWGVELEKRHKHVGTTYGSCAKWNYRILLHSFFLYFQHSELGHGNLVLGSITSYNHITHECQHQDHSRDLPPYRVQCPGYQEILISTVSPSCRDGSLSDYLHDFIITLHRLIWLLEPVACHVFVHKVCREVL